MENISKSLLATSLLVIASSVSALQIQIGSDLVDVGSVDNFIVSDSVHPSNLSGELTWVSSQLTNAINVSFAHKTETGITWNAVIGESNVYAFELNNAANNYFLLKLGANPSHFLYENIDSNNYAVIDFSLFEGLKNNIDTTIVSHITEFEVEDNLANPSEVPVPAAVWLFGSALLGLGFKKRR